ncbi:hypothetical protein DC498_12880 [Terrimonas sp.]|nr:hypothetical protein DC498_12880 [Terrimonas sp.]
MKTLPIISVFIYSTLLGCSTGQPNSDNKTDSTKHIEKIDTTDFVQQSIDELRNEFLSQYSKPILIDTSFIDSDIKYQVLFRHESSNDSGIVVPARYDFDTHKDFVTYNLISELTLLSDNDTLFHTTITKSLFDRLLSTELRQHATLLYPNFYIANDTIKLHYSISIPTTDVGIGATIKFAKNGSYIIED